MVTFSFDAGDNNLPSIVKDIGGVQLTVSNRSPAGNFQTDGDGVCVAGISGFCNFGIDSLDLTFDSAVQLIGYNIGFNNSTDFGLTFTQGANVSAEGTNLGVGDRLFANQFNVMANTPIILTNQGPGFTLQIKSITVNSTPTAVPLESDDLPVAATTVLMGGAMWWKRRSNKIKIQPIDIKSA